MSADLFTICNFKSIFTGLTQHSSTISSRARIYPHFIRCSFSVFIILHYEWICYFRNIYTRNSVMECLCLLFSPLFQLQPTVPRRFLAVCFEKSNPIGWICRIVDIFPLFTNEFCVQVFSSHRLALSTKFFRCCL